MSVPHTHPLLRAARSAVAAKAVVRALAHLPPADQVAVVRIVLAELKKRLAAAQ